MTTKDDVKVLSWVQQAFSAAGVELKDMNMTRLEDGKYSLTLNVVANPEQLQQEIVEVVKQTVTEDRKPKIKTHEEKLNVAETQHLVKISSEKEASPILLDVFDTLGEVMVSRPDGVSFEDEEKPVVKASSKSKRQSKVQPVEVEVVPISSDIDENVIARMFAD